MTEEKWAVVFGFGPVVMCAIAWWEQHRPCAYTQEQHIEQYQVNCVGEREKALAKAVSELVVLLDKTH